MNTPVVTPRPVLSKAATSTGPAARGNMRSKDSSTPPGKANSNHARAAATENRTNTPSNNRCRSLATSAGFQIIRYSANTDAAAMPMITIAPREPSSILALRGES